ncbi:MAG: DNA repair protein RadA, partial [Acetobacteraceae bacterium]
MVAKSAPRFICQSCGAAFPKWAGRCEACDAWNSIVEEHAEVRPGPAGKA